MFCMSLEMQKVGACALVTLGETYIPVPALGYRLLKRSTTRPALTTAIPKSTSQNSTRNVRYSPKHGDCLFFFIVYGTFQRTAWESPFAVLINEYDDEDKYLVRHTPYRESFPQARSVRK